MGVADHLDRRHGQGSSPTPASRSPWSKRSPGSQRCSTGASRPCTRASWPASWRAATCPSTWRPSRSTASSPSTWSSQPLSRSRRRRRSAASTSRRSIENIDIGGPSMIRAAAKNHAGVAVVTEHRRLRRGRSTRCASNGGELSYEPRCAASPPRPSSAPPTTTSSSPTGSARARATSRDYVMRDYEKVLELKYGENPHQRAAYYAEVGPRQHLLSQVTQLHGKQLGVQQPLRPQRGARHLRRVHAAVRARSSSTTTPAAAPCAENLAAAYDKAFECDPASAFGSVIAVNRTVDVPTRRAPHRAVRRGAVRARLRRRTRSRS